MEVQMDGLSKLDEVDEILSENEEGYIESNWRKVEDHSAAATELLSHANAKTASSLIGSRESVQSTVLDPLIALERTARMSGDIHTVVRLVEEIVNVYFAIADFADLQKVAKYLMKARGQSPQVQAALLKKFMAGIHSLGVVIPFCADEDIAEHPETNRTGVTFSTDRFTPVAFYSDIGDSSQWKAESFAIHDLLLLVRTLSHGKMHVELEYAQASMILTKVLQNQGNMSTALNTIDKVGIERLAAISRFEKTKCLLYQLSLARESRNFVAFEKVVRKVSRSTLEKPENAWLYRTYLLHLVNYFSHYDKSFATFLCYWELFLCRDADTAVEPLILRRALFYLLLAPPESAEQRKDAIDCTIFTKKYGGKLNRSDWIEFFHCAFEENDTKSRFSDLERESIAKSDCLSNLGVRNVLQFFVGRKWIPVESFCAALETSKISQDFTLDAKSNEKIRQRFAEKIILIVSYYYVNITLSRLSRLVSAPEDDVEALLRSMVSQKRLSVKIDRVDGVVEFTSNSSPKDIDICNDSVKEILELVDETCHLIEKQQLNQRVEA